MAPTALLVTSNRHKLEEARAIVAPLGVRLRGRSRRLPEPQADTLEEVARAKLRSLGAIRGPVLVEDSGLFLEGLHGFPGVYSAYAFRTLGLDGLLRALADRPREARFRTVVGLRNGSRIHLFAGELAGRISREPRGSGGFGFDPIFEPRGGSRTLAELPPGTKNRISHRGLAFRAAARRLGGTSGELRPGPPVPAPRHRRSATH